MPTDLASRPKSALVKQVESMYRSRAREKSRAMEVGTRVSDLLGTGLAMATGAAVGAAEGRFRNKDRTPLSLGPVPLPLAVAAVSSAAGLFTGRRAFNYAAAGAVGAFGYNIGKGWGAKALSKAGRVSGVGEDWELNDAERAVVFGVED